MRWSWLIFLAPAALAAADSVHVLTAQQWAVPRSGKAIVELPPVREAMQAMRETEGSRLIIRYPGGDEGTLWARELHAWLVALGLGSQHIEIQPGSRQADTIEMQVVPR